jgi:two-component system, OmpR family, sensor histidine kinase KdpD
MGRRVRAVAGGIALPGAATVIAVAIPHAGVATAASLYFLAVASAAAFGGLPGGLVASAAGFLGLNYFFTPPRHTFDIGSVDDTVALAVFLAVAAFVSALLARFVAERRLAERREREARSLHRVTSAFLLRAPLERVVSDLAGTLADVLSLARCEIHALVGDTPLDVSAGPGPAEAGSDGVGQGERFELPLETVRERYGTLVAFARAGAGPLTQEEEALARAVAGQIAVALERTRLDEEIASARLDAESSAARAALFSSVTHDLRTPLASIKASVTSLLDEHGNLDGGQRGDLLRTILEETDRLNRLVGNLVDLARLRAGALVPSRVTVDIEDVIGSVLSRMRGALGGRHVRTRYRPDLPAVPLDPTQMDQVLTNLLENAIRFSPPGGEIQVFVTTWQTWLEVRIADRGPGIPAERRDQVFEAFFREDRSTGRGGTGLGLSIARAIVEAHGGRIWVEGAPGGGAVIAFRLPLSARADDRAAVRAGNSTTRDG